MLQSSRRKLLDFLSEEHDEQKGTLFDVSAFSKQITLIDYLSHMKEISLRKTSKRDKVLSAFLVLFYSLENNEDDDDKLKEDIQKCSRVITQYTRGPDSVDKRHTTINKNMHDLKCHLLKQL